MNSNKLSEPTKILSRLLDDSLDETERTSIEQKLLNDDGYYEQLLAAETELIDHYIHGDCDHEQTQSLDRTIGISSNLQDKAVLSKVINQWINDQKQPKKIQPPIFTKIIMGLAIVAVLLTIFFLFTQQRLIQQQQQEILQLQQDQSAMTEKQQRLEQQLGRLELLYQSLQEKTSGQ